MQKVKTSIKVILVVLALGFLTIQAEKQGYFNHQSLKSRLVSLIKERITQPLTSAKSAKALSTTKDRLNVPASGHLNPVIVVADSTTDSLACSKIQITKTGNDVTINNENDQEVIVYYSVRENGQETKTGNLMVEANTLVDFSEQVPGNGKIVFSMGANNIPDSTVVTGAFCAVKTGTKTVVVGETIETIQVYEGKAYDARDLSWFNFVERQRLRDLNGNTVEESDKGVSLEDLTTIADETDLRVDFKAGRIGYTDAIVWFKIENDLPTAPQLLINNLTSLATATGTVNGTIPADTRMGFVLVGDVAAKNPIVQNPNAQLRFEGTRLQYSTDNGASWNTIPEHQLVYSIKDWNKNQHESVVAGISDHPTKADEKVLTVVFEDIPGGVGDLDYEDVRCTVYLQGVTKLKTKVIKETKEVDVYTQIPCGDCEVTISGIDHSQITGNCTDSTYRYSASNVSFSISGSLLTFEKNAYLDIHKDSSGIHLYGFATTTINNEPVRYLVDITSSQTNDSLVFSLDENKSVISSEDGTPLFRLANPSFFIVWKGNVRDVNIEILGYFTLKEIETETISVSNLLFEVRNMCPAVDLECPPDAFRHTISDAVPDNAYDGNDDYGIQIKDLLVEGENIHLNFEPNNAYLDITKGGSVVRILGYATGGEDDHQSRYLVNIDLKRAGEPMLAQKELKPGYQTDEIIKDWRFFKIDQATITNINTFEAIKLTQSSIDNTISLQVGQTANGRNVNYGASASFNWEGESTGRKGEGSLHVDLEKLCSEQPLPELCKLPVEVIYVLDKSGSMKSPYPQTDGSGQQMSRFRAAQNALIYANNTLAKQGVVSRSALVVFNDFSAQVVSGYTEDFEEINALVEEVSEPYSATPMAKALSQAKDVLKLHDPTKRPVIVLISDGVPTVDLGRLIYDDVAVAGVELFNSATQTYRTKEEVALLGGINPRNTQPEPVYQGKVLAEVMDMFEQIQTQTPNVLIYGLGIEQGSQVQSESFSAELLKYGAYKTGAKYHSVQNAQGMVQSIADILVDATCNNHYIPGEVGLQVTKTVDKDSVAVGDIIQYTITVTNHGPDKVGNDVDDSKAVKLTDVIPAGLDLISVTGGTFDANGVMSLGAIGSTESKTVTIKAMTITAGIITNTATISMVGLVDSNLSNNSSSATTFVFEGINQTAIQDEDITVGPNPASDFVEVNMANLFNKSKLDFGLLNYRTLRGNSS